jgi:phosphatidylglycerol:prolipoprotein diacylglycerol transferase
MSPRLLELEIFGQQLYLPAYFSMVAVGFVLAAILLRRWARFHGLDHRLMIDFVIWMALWGVVGSRILHVLADGHLRDYVNVCLDPSKVDWKVDARECAALEGAWDAARDVCHPVETNCLAFADVFRGGFAYYGGLIAAALFSIWFIRRHRLPAGKILDMSGWAITLGLAWGRIGCFLASCCFGARCEGPWSVAFPPGSAASRHHWDQGLLGTYRHESLHVHPTQLYEAVGSLVLAALVYFVLRPRKRFDGQVFAVAMIGYAALRFGLEFLREDERGAFGPFSTSQWIAIAIVVFCAFLWRHMSRRARRATKAATTRPAP